MEQNSCSLVLRLFGPQLDQVTQVLRTAASQGCPGLNLLMKNGEYAVCVTARGGNAASVCRRCRTTLKAASATRCSVWAKRAWPMWRWRRWQSPAGCSLRRTPPPASCWTPPSPDATRRAAFTTSAPRATPTPSGGAGGAQQAPSKEIPPLPGAARRHPRPRGAAGLRGGLGRGLLPRRRSAPRLRAHLQRQIRLGAAPARGRR